MAKKQKITDVNISPSFCFFGEEQQTQNNEPGPVTINISPSFCFFGEQQQTQNNEPGPVTINISPSFCFFGEHIQNNNSEGNKSLLQQKQNKPLEPSPDQGRLHCVVNTNTSPSYPFGLPPSSPFSSSPFPVNSPTTPFGLPPSSTLFGEQQQQRQKKFSTPLFRPRQKKGSNYFCGPQQPKPEQETLVNLGESMVKQTDFSLSLAKYVINTEAKDKNFVFSPLSMHVVLSMVASGSGGPTRVQLLDYLKSSSSVEGLNSLSSRIATLLFADGGHRGGAHMSFANGVWVDQSHTLKPAFKEIVHNVYKAASNQADFRNKADEERKEVNSWAEKETNGLIKDLLPPGSVNPETSLILANALYFKGIWENKFDASRTKDHDFFLRNGTKVQVPFMTSWKRQFVSAFDGFKVLRLPYKQGEDSRKFSMLIYLPDDRDGLPALLHKFGSVPEFIQNHFPYCSENVREFRVPKFKIGFGFEATKVLKGHGLVLPFSPGGLTEMVQNGGEVLYITSFHHKSCIEVDEQGTEAAAALACVIRASNSMGCPEPEVDFVADHPFLFVVREDVSGGVLFVGQVVDPSAA